MKHAEPEGLLSTAARTVGHAAGEAAKALGFENAEAAKPVKATKKPGTKPKGAKRVSARSNRIARAAAAKKSDGVLGKAAAGVRYRRIMGKKPAAWSDADVDYIEGLKLTKKRGAPA